MSRAARTTGQRSVESRQLLNLGPDSAIQDFLRIVLLLALLWVVLSAQ